MPNLSREDIQHNLEKKLKEQQRKVKVFLIDNTTKYKTDDLADKIAAWGIKTVIRK